MVKTILQGGPVQRGQDTDLQFPEETQPSDKGKLDFYAEEIGQRWRATTESILTLADLCKAAIKTLSIGEIRSLQERLRFNKSTLSKLLKISGDPRLQSQPLRGLLPPNYTILYEICRLSPAQLQEAIARKIIHPRMHRKDLKAFMPPEKRRKPERIFLGSIFQFNDVAPERTEVFKNQIKKIVMQFPDFGMQGKASGWSFQNARPGRETAGA